MRAERADLSRLRSCGMAELAERQNKVLRASSDRHLRSQYRSNRQFRNSVESSLIHFDAAILDIAASTTPGSN
jgi:hypothetical protein